MKIGFFGRGKTGISVLEAIIDQGFEVPLIWTCKHTAEVEGTPDEFERIAEKNNITYEYVDDINDEQRREQILSADLNIAIAISWNDIIEEQILNAVEDGILNLHGGNLPRYRGNAASNWAILNNESQIGVTVHRMSSQLDAGPVLLQDSIPITPETTVGDLIEKSRNLGTHMILKILISKRNGNMIPEKPQDESEKLRCYPRIPEYGRIDWEQSSKQIDKHIRSLIGPYPTAFTYYERTKIKITDAEPVDHDGDFLAEPGHIIATEPGGSIQVATGDGVLKIKKIRIEDGQELSPGEEFTSIRQRFGMNVTKHIRELENRIKVLENQEN